jgi:hypothetical protein
VLGYGHRRTGVKVIYGKRADQDHPHGCTAETDTHIFAAADDGFSRLENEYTVSYVWPFNLSMLTPGLDTKKFSDIIRRNLTRLANNTRHNIPLEVALRAVGAEF